MHPTGAEQLAAVRRRLGLVATDPGLTPGSVETLAEVIRQLERLEGSWSARLPFLVADNRATAELLAELGAPIGPATTTDTPHLDEERAHELNKALREQLAAVVRSLPASAEGDPARARVAGHLRLRLAADPALNRRTVPYPAPAAPSDDRITP